MIIVMHDGLPTTCRSPLSLRRLLVAVLSLLAALAVPLTPASADAVESDPARGLRGIDLTTAGNDLRDNASEVRAGRTVHGDLDGDGDSDAAVVVSFWENDDVYWSVQAYRNDDGFAVPAGRTQSFSEQWDRFDRMVIAGGVIEFTVSAGHDQNVGWLTTHRWDLVDGSMRLLENISSGSLLSLTRGGGQPLVSAYSRSMFVDVAPDVVEPSFRFETSEAESVQLRSDDSTAELRVYSATTHALETVVDTASLATLPAGTWIGVPEISSDRSVRLLLSIADQRALYAPQLGVRMRENGQDSVAPRRSVSVAWHEVTWAHGDVDLNRVNAQVRSFVDALESEYMAAAAMCPEDADATLYVGSTPRLVSYDLVSFEFSVASRLCEQNDDVRYRSLVIDLASGEVLDAADLLLVGSAGVVATWWQEIVDHRDWLLESDLRHPVGSPVTFSSISVDPRGLALSVLGSDLATDIRGPVTVHLNWNQLHGIGNPAIQIRAESGQDVLLPSEGCGC